jgi:hypothetical protein
MARTMAEKVEIFLLDGLIFLSLTSLSKYLAPSLHVVASSILAEAGDRAERHGGNAAADLSAADFAPLPESRKAA